MLQYACALFLLIVLFAAAQPAHGRLSPPTTQPDSVRVWLVTIGPGEQVWERFGHNMIWIHDPKQRAGGPDAAYNFGLFDFSNFIPNFLAKNMRYWMDAFNAGPNIQDYADADRSVWIQELNLTDSQKERLITNLEVNRSPENKFYNYDYYTDNCSTRVRDSLDAVVDGAIRDHFKPINTRTTYRWHTRRLLADDWPSDLAIHFVEGRYVDREINQWEESFLPVRFMQHIRTLPAGSGPLVLSERTLHLSTKYPERDAAPNRLPPYLLVGILVGAAMLPFGLAKGRWARSASAAVMFLWCLLGTVASVSLLYLWLATPHLPPARNENILALGPLSISLLALLPFFRRVSRIAMYVGLANAAFSVLGLLIQVLPNLNQVNGDIIALTLPANLGLATALCFSHQRLRGLLGPPTRKTPAPEFE